MPHLTGDAWRLAHPAETCARGRQLTERARAASLAASAVKCGPPSPEKEKARHLKWRLENPEKIRGYKLAERYGISMKEFNILLLVQCGTCAICGSAEVHVDHDHASGHIRGLLCGACNRGIGLLRDAPQLLRAAADYLEVSA